MKKRIIALLASLLSLFLLFSCGTDDTDGGAGDETDGGTNEGSDGGESPKEDLIYSPDVTPSIIIGDKTLAADERTAVYSAIKALTGQAPDSASSSVEVRDHEIILGKCDRELSVLAYKKLNFAIKDDEEVGFYILSDGNSIAVAYSDDEYGISARKAVDYLVNNIFGSNSTLTLKKNYSASDSFDLTDALRLEDDEYRNQKWLELANLLGDEGAEVVTALKEFYTLYESRAIEWFASLYDPGTGGFYHSNSGRDTYGYLPDVESNAKIFALINQCGMTRGHSGYQDVLSEEMKKQVADFVYNLQSDDGFFYHPQWGTNITLSRRGRDLSWSVDILKKLGRTPKYKTVTGVGGEDLEARIGNQSTVAAVSKVVAAASIPEHLASEEAFRAYLAGLNIRENSYNKGNELSSQSSQIRAQKLDKILIEFLNENQFENNGLWHATSDYYGVNGLMKISGIYSGSKVAIPNADKAINAAIDAILSEELPGSVVSFYNPWAAVTRILENQRKYGGEEGKKLADAIHLELLEKAPEAIRVTRAKVARHKREDGAFSYYPGRSVHVSQNAPVCVPNTVESDVAGACISITGITGYIFSALEISSYKIPIYGKAELKIFNDTIKSLTPIIKEKPERKPIDFEDYEVGERPAGFKSISMKSDGASFLIDAEGDNKFAKFVSNKGKGDAVAITLAENEGDVKGFEFSAKLCVKEVSATGTKEGAFLRLEFYDATAHAYRLMFLKDGDKVKLVDASTNTPSTAKYNEIGKFGFGEWFDLKIEYTAGTKETLDVKVYVNGLLVLESKNYFDESCALEQPHTGVNEMKFFSWVNAQDVILIDDLYFYATTGNAQQ